MGCSLRWPMTRTTASAALRPTMPRSRTIQDGSWRFAISENNQANPSITATGSVPVELPFLFVPWTARNLVAAHDRHQRRAGAERRFVHDPAAFDRSLRADPSGKTDADGSLLLINSGYLANPPAGTENVVDNSFLSYQFLEGGRSGRGPSSLKPVRSMPAEAERGPWSCRGCGLQFSCGWTSRIPSPFLRLRRRSVCPRPMDPLRFLGRPR